MILNVVPLRTVSLNVSVGNVFEARQMESHKLWKMIDEARLKKGEVAIIDDDGKKIIIRDESETYGYDGEY